MGLFGTLRLVQTYLPMFGLGSEFWSQYVDAKSVVSGAIAAVLATFALLMIKNILGLRTKVWSLFRDVGWAILEGCRAYRARRSAQSATITGEPNQPAPARELRLSFENIRSEDHFRRELRSHLQLCANRRSSGLCLWFENSSGGKVEAVCAILLRIDEFSLHAREYKGIKHVPLQLTPLMGISPNNTSHAHNFLEVLNPTVRNCIEVRDHHGAAGPTFTEKGMWRCEILVIVNLGSSNRLDSWIGKVTLWFSWTPGNLPAFAEDPEEALARLRGSDVGTLGIVRE